MDWVKRSAFFFRSIKLFFAEPLQLIYLSSWLLKKEQKNAPANEDFLQLDQGIFIDFDHP